MNYLKDLNWRYATKRMKGGKIPSTALNNILEAARLAPTSMGLQPFEILVVEDAELRAMLSPAINQQPQVREGSALLIFAAWTSITEEKVVDYMKNIAATRNIDINSLEGFKNTILGIAKGKTDGEILNWNARQAYIALGYSTAAAAFEKIDSTPMEGFNAKELNRVLGLEEKGLSAVAILALGYRDEEKDPMAKALKVRRPLEQFHTVLEPESVA